MRKGAGRFFPLLSLLPFLLLLGRVASADPLIFSNEKTFTSAPTGSDLVAWINGLAQKRMKPVELKLEHTGGRSWTVSLRAGENRVSGNIDYFEEPWCDQVADHVTGMALRANVPLALTCAAVGDHRWKFLLRSYLPGNPQDPRAAGSSRKGEIGSGPAGPAEQGLSRTGTAR